MRVAKTEITLELDRDEIDIIGWSLYRGLKNSIVNHYNKLQQEVDGEPIFYEQERMQINLMGDMVSLIGRRDLAENFDREFKGMFEDRRKEREAKREAK